MVRVRREKALVASGQAIRTSRSHGCCIPSINEPHVSKSNDLANSVEKAKRSVGGSAFAYLRVSGKGQINGDGFPRQAAAITKHAKAHGLTVSRVFREEGICGETEFVAYSCPIPTSSCPFAMHLLATISRVRNGISVYSSLLLAAGDLFRR
jgi:hypothetical protein